MKLLMKSLDDYKNIIRPLIFLYKYYKTYLEYLYINLIPSYSYINLLLIIYITVFLHHKITIYVCYEFL
jgi:hypothetical protein